MSLLAAQGRAQRAKNALKPGEIVLSCSILPIDTELTWLPIDALGLRASLLVSGGNYHGAENIYGVNNPQLNYSAVATDLGARLFILPPMHLTIHGGYTLHRRFEFSEVAKRCRVATTNWPTARFSGSTSGSAADRAVC